MTKTTVSTPAAPQAIGPYSQGIAFDSGRPARTLYASGQIPLDPASGQLVQGDVAAQTERVLVNLRAILEAEGMGFRDVVKTTVYLTDLADFAAMNEVYARRFSPGPAGPFPARSTVQVAALPRGAKVEIDAVAVR